MLRGEEQVMQGRTPVKSAEAVSKREEFDDRQILIWTAGRAQSLWDCCVVLFPGHGCSSLFIFGVLYQC